MRILAFILLSIILSQTAIKGGVFIWFKSNQVRLAATSCENRDLPMMNCNGKCILAKKLKAAEERKENPAIPGSILTKELQPMIMGNVEAEEPHSDIEHSYEFQEMKEAYAFLPLFDIFHPPKWTS